MHPSRCGPRGRAWVCKVSSQLRLQWPQKHHSRAGINPAAPGPPSGCKKHLSRAGSHTLRAHQHKVHVAPARGMIPGQAWDPESRTVHPGTARHSPRDSQAKPLFSGPRFSICKMGGEGWSPGLSVRLSVCPSGSKQCRLQLQFALLYSPLS